MRGAREQQLVAIEARQLEVAQHHVDRLGEQQAEPAQAVGRLQDLIEKTRRFDRRADLRAMHLGVVDEQIVATRPPLRTLGPRRYRRSRPGSL